MDARAGGRAPESRGFRAELPEQGDPPIGDELIRVTFEDGRVQELRLHDYERLYSLPGVYEQIVHDRLGCRSPAVMASLLAVAVDAAGWERSGVNVLDIAAGNGLSGEALAAEGLRPVLGTDIVPTAREAALRDRPGVYDDYLVLDLLALEDDDRRALAGLRASALSCVAPVGEHPSQLPPRALLAAAQLLEPDALVAYMHDPGVRESDAVTPELWGSGIEAEELTRYRYAHRRTVNGEPYEMVGVVWRLRRT